MKFLIVSSVLLAMIFYSLLDSGDGKSHRVPGIMNPNGKPCPQSNLTQTFVLNNNQTVTCVCQGRKLWKLRWRCNPPSTTSTPSSNTTSTTTTTSSTSTST